MPNTESKRRFIAQRRRQIADRSALQIPFPTLSPTGSPANQVDRYITTRMKHIPFPTLSPTGSPANQVDRYITTRMKHISRHY